MTARSSGSSPCRCRCDSCARDSRGADGLDPRGDRRSGRAAGRAEGRHRELRELARGIHPAILTEAGLGAAITSLAGSVGRAGRRDRAARPAAAPGVEATAYFVVSEALANVAKHAAATRGGVGASATAAASGSRSATTVSAAPIAAGAPGCAGLQDRVAALGGRLTVDSPPARGRSSSPRSRSPDDGHAGQG